MKGKIEIYMYATELVSKFNVGLKISFTLRPAEREFYSDILFKFKTIMERTVFISFEKLYVTNVLAMI